MQHVSRITGIALLLTLIVCGCVTVQPAECHAVIVQSVAPGSASVLRDILTESGWSGESIKCTGNDEPFAQYCESTVSAESVLSAISDTAQVTGENDLVLIAFVTHMSKGYLLDGELTAIELNAAVEEFPEGATVVVLIEGCYSSDHLEFVGSADVVYVSAGSDETCYGGWMELFLDALGADEEAHGAADVNKDERVSLGEAYDYAADVERLGEWYDMLPDEVWSPYTPVPRPSRRVSVDDYEIYIDIRK